MDRVTLWLVRAAVVLFALLVIGGVVGGIIYGPRLTKLAKEAAQGRADTAVGAAETQYQTDTGQMQARTQAAEVAVTLQMQESTRETLSSPDAGALISPDVYGRFRDGVRRNRAVGGPTGDGAGAAGQHAAAGTADPEP